MKKSLLALAVLGAFAGVASAQSSVTIYGLLDQGVYKGNGGTAALPGGAAGSANPGANGTSEAWQLKQAAGSRLGFRGNEDLGGGLSAQFHIEHRFTPDDGAAATPFWAGRSYVQLTSTAVGSVYLGREYTPEFWIMVKSDPFGWDGVGQVSALQQAGFAATNGGSSVRTSNTVGYKTPNLGGLTANAAVGLAEGVATANRHQALNVEYSGGPIYAGVAYAKLTEGQASTDGNSIINAAFHYNFGVAKAIVYAARAKTNAGNDSNKVVELAATANLGPGVLKAAVARLDPQGDDNSVTKLGLGYNYFLSKRTNLYLDFGHAKSDVAGQTKNTAYALGVKHTF
jgi:predicted porin